MEQLSIMSQIEQVVKQIQSEFRVNPNGQVFTSIRGAARLADIDESSIRTALHSAGQKPSRLAEFLIQEGFEGAELISWVTTGIPDIALALILEYYAHECQERYRSEQAKLCCRAFNSIGIRDWVKKSIGWEVQPANGITKTESRIEEMLAQNQQMMQQSQQMMMAIAMMCQQQGIQMESLALQVSSVDTRLTRIESNRDEAIAELDEAEPPSVEAEDLTTRAKLNRLVRDYSAATAIPFSEVWKRVYREFRDRYHVDLKQRSKNIQGSGGKKLSSLDVCENLGMIEQLYAVAFALLKA
jgi:hypothetical protein